MKHNYYLGDIVTTIYPSTFIGYVTQVNEAGYYLVTWNLRDKVFQMVEHPLDMTLVSSILRDDYA